MTPGSSAARFTRDALPFAMTPEWVLFAPDLSSNAKALYGVLMRYANDQGQCWPGQDTLAEKMGVSRSTIKRILAELRDFGCLSVIARFDDDGAQTSNNYHLHWTKRETTSPTGGLPPGSPTNRPPVHEQPGPRFTDAPQTRAIEREPTEGEYETSSRAIVHPLLDPLPRREEPLVTITTYPAEEAEPSPPAPPPPSPTLYEDWAWLCSQFDWNPGLNKGRALKAIKTMKESGVTVLDIYQCASWLREQPYWRDKGIDVFTAQSQMQRYLDYRGQPPPPARLTMQERYEQDVRELKEQFGED